MTTIRAVHEYTPIESATQIRILALQPAPNFEHPIKATIITRPLEPDFRSYRLTQPIPYQAVSYCWGPSDSGLALECDGKRIRISSNVDCMLRHLRKTSGPRNLWVDSICINQANVPEKTAQVQCMGKIYRRAQKVHIWLGDACPEDHIPWVFNSLQSLTVLETLPSPDAFDGLEDGKELLGRFISRPWFGRRWILQELALAQDATVHCGHHKISWNWLKEGLNLLTQESAVARFGFNYKAAERIRGVVSMKKPSRDFLERIFGLHLSDCLDSRDRFYSLYSIEGDFSVGTPKQNAKWHHPCMPNVDYSKDWMHLYIDFAKQHIATGHFPTILQHVLSFGSLYDQSPD
ncbi:HET-domain-containing protein, partial [Amniculicola lignicola CBS 123094]